MPNFKRTSDTFPVPETPVLTQTQLSLTHTKYLTVLKYIWLSLLNMCNIIWIMYTLSIIKFGKFGFYINYFFHNYIHYSLHYFLIKVWNISMNLHPFSSWPYSGLKAVNVHLVFRLLNFPFPLVSSRVVNMNYIIS